MALTVRIKSGKAEPVLHGRAWWWHVIRDLGKRNGTFSVRDVTARCNGQSQTAVWRFVADLEREGILARAGVTESRRKRLVPLYQLVSIPAGPPLAIRRQGRRREQQMWNMMRGPSGRNGFTVSDLALYASTDEVEIGRASAVRYVSWLAAAGYLAEAGRSGRGAKAIVWRLKPSMNTGPKPPLMVSGKVLFDQNHNRTAADMLAEAVAA